MKISIITICYNEPDIKKTCESIVNQTYQDFEWIVIDGGSNEQTLDILNTYKSRINVFISEKDAGIYNAMNKGINLAKGDYLNFLNAGDTYYDNNSLSKASKYLDNIDIIFGDLKFLQVGKYRRKFVKKYPDKIEPGWFIDESLPHPSSFIKKELFDKFGLYNENYKIVSDWEKWIEFFEVNKCSYKHIPITISSYNCSGIASNSDALQQKERAEVILKYYNLDGITSPTKKIIKFLNIPLMKIIKKFNFTTYYLFGIFPILKIIHLNNSNPPLH